MIAECYTADVYCDMPGHRYNSLGNGREQCSQYTGRNKRETDKKRRLDGWVKIAGQDCCPECRLRLKFKSKQ